MTGVPATAAERLLTELAELRHAAGEPSYTTLVRQAAAQQPPLAITAQRLSDWFGRKAVPAHPAVVRFLVEYLQPRAVRTDRYQSRPVAWWLDLHQEAVRQRQAGANERRHPADAPSHRLGRPIDQCDPLALEVHPAIQVPGTGTVPDLLPGYLPRSHDARLREVVDHMLDGGLSRLVTLVGGSSTGKTRACWELVRYLDGRQPRRWWVWHPFDPTHPQAALADLDRVGPYTVVWLNEAQHYLMPTDEGLGERIAAGLRTLVTDPGRGPVLLLATAWPQYWSTLTTRPAADAPDPYAQARDLLAAGTAITVPDAFTPAELAGLDAEADPRVDLAAAHAEAGRITQYLAGAPALEDRYRNAPPAARAIIQAAMDARRLGHPLALPHALLEQAAPGYLDDHDWDTLGEDWLEQALAYTATPCKGARGPLTRIRARPDDPPRQDGQPCYRLADYLEQLGRTERAGIYPPDSLWHRFATTITDPNLLRHLGQQAEHRGRYQHAIWLYTPAASRGDFDALFTLGAMRERAGDIAGAEVLYTQAAECGSVGALWALAQLRKETGDAAGIEALYMRAADRGKLGGLQGLAQLREKAGDTAAADALYLQAADRGHAVALRGLVQLREKAGDRASAEALAVQAAHQGDAIPLGDLAWLREEAGDIAAAEALYLQAADRGHASALSSLVELREKAGDRASAEALAVQAADQGDAIPLWWLAWLRKKAGDLASAEALYVQAADRGHAGALWRLAQLRRETGDLASAEALYVQAADCGEVGWLWGLVELRAEAGDHAGAEAIAVQAGSRGDASALRALAELRLQAGDQAGAEALAVQAASCGDAHTLLKLAWLRKEAGNLAHAEALYLQAADRGELGAVLELSNLRALADDAVGADGLRRFGLTGSGKIATRLDFGP
ncbi:tetratricopeptide repeat protein [Virgisporangium aurantiacum]|uniref:TPR repeat n=1 Tax=Virgisporangium aurantiacum TaxID=175570 RepID=A0A8J3ZFL4_9ACTN|nr:hypothetical protein [Virgisporangium aurantiacum]GIJ63044.1 hypothetical protein Vau01_105600 [Virgisporangium aurantiacum]